LPATYLFSKRSWLAAQNPRLQQGRLVSESRFTAPYVYLWRNMSRLERSMCPILGHHHHMLCSLIVGLVSFLSLAGFACVQTVSAQEQHRQSGGSDPQALELVRSAITAMGGAEAWKDIGAATAEVTISRPGGPTNIIKWSDDWHAASIMSRRDALVAGGKEITSVKGERSREISAPGKTRKLPAEEEITVLAVGYPAAALMLSLRRSDCLLHVMPAPNSQQAASASKASMNVIAEDCHAAGYPKGVRILWAFSSSSSLPMWAKLPIRDALRNIVSYETARFDTYSQSSNVTLPSTVTIFRPSGASDKLEISKWSFKPSLPSQTFRLSEQTN
jgi:hypothetical protein